MKKSNWINHMKASGLSQPSEGGSLKLWQEACKRHLADNCPDCKARIKTTRATANRKSRDDAMRSCGLVKTPYGWE